MPIQNVEIAEIFDRVAKLLDIQGENPFRVRAYLNAARVVGGWPESLERALRDQGHLPKLPGIGEDLQSKIQEIIRTQKLELLGKLTKKTPASLLGLLKIPALGPKRVRLLLETLGVRTLKDLQAALRSGKLRTLPGFGEKIEARIKQELSSQPQGAERIRLAVASQIAAPLVEYLRSFPELKQITVAGSYRRRAETVGDLDILITTSSKKNADLRAMDHFTAYEGIREILSHGPTRSTVILYSGLQVDVRVVPPESYGSALHYFTGSKSHNIAVRKMGQAKGLKINEYGVFKGEKRIAGKSEEEVYRCVGLPYIEPELRENRGELEAARSKKLPRLIELSQIRGDVHAHTDATDGRDTLEKMVGAAIERGYEYLAITDHTQRLTVARGQDPKRIRAQIRKIQKLQERYPDFRILKSAEVDILEDGKLDLPDDVLAELDLTVCSVHSYFQLSAEKQTERILRAMDHPAFSILGHATGRLVLQRKPYELDVERILSGARDRGVMLEINAQPERMDLPDSYCQLGKKLGCRFVISTDAHCVSDFDWMGMGVSVARRGWIESKDVFNTLPWNKARKWLRSKNR